MSQDPIGLDSARQRGVSKADVIASVEPVGAGELLITVGTVHLRSHGDLSRIYEGETLRLTPADVTRLIKLLTLAQVTS